jgi:hypothetical protein
VSYAPLVQADDTIDEAGYLGRNADRALPAMIFTLLFAVMDCHAGLKRRLHGGRGPADAQAAARGTNPFNSQSKGPQGSLYLADILRRRAVPAC